MLLFRVLFVLLQFAVRLTLTLLDWTSKINQLKLPLKHDMAKLRTDSKSLKRLPLHVGIVIVEEGISFVDLANILLWCMAMGISYISIYDATGKIIIIGTATATGPVLWVTGTNYVDVGRGRCRPQCNYIGKLKWPSV